MAGAPGGTQRVQREGVGRGSWGVASTEASLFWALGKEALNACRGRWERTRKGAWVEQEGRQGSDRPPAPFHSRSRLRLRATCPWPP